MRFTLKKKKTSSLSYAYVLNKTLDFIISRRCFAEKGKQMYQKLVCWLNLLFYDALVAVVVVEPRASELNCAWKGHWVENARFLEVFFDDRNIECCTQAASFLSRISFNKESRRRLVKEKELPSFAKHDKKKTYAIKTSEDIDS